MFRCQQCYFHKWLIPYIVFWRFWFCNDFKPTSPCYTWLNARVGWGWEQNVSEGIYKQIFVCSIDKKSSLIQNMRQPFFCLVLDLFISMTPLALCCKHALIYSLLTCLIGKTPRNGMQSQSQVRDCPERPLVQHLTWPIDWYDPCQEPCVTHKSTVTMINVSLVRDRVMRSADRRIFTF